MQANKKITNSYADYPQINPYYEPTHVVISNPEGNILLLIHTLIKENVITGLTKKDYAEIVKLYQNTLFLAKTEKGDNYKVKKPNLNSEDGLIKFADIIAKAQITKNAALTIIGGFCGSDYHSSDYATLILYKTLSKLNKFSLPVTDRVWYFVQNNTKDVPIYNGQEPRTVYSYKNMNGLLNSGSVEKLKEKLGDHKDLVQTVLRPHLVLFSLDKSLKKNDLYLYGYHPCDLAIIANFCKATGCSFDATNTQKLLESIVRLNECFSFMINNFYPTIIDLIKWSNDHGKTDKPVKSDVKIDYEKIKDLYQTLFNKSLSLNEMEEDEKFFEKFAKELGSAFIQFINLNTVREKVTTEIHNLQRQVTQSTKEQEIKLEKLVIKENRGLTQKEIKFSNDHCALLFNFSGNVYRSFIYPNLKQSIKEIHAVAQRIGQLDKICLEKIKGSMIPYHSNAIEKNDQLEQYGQLKANLKSLIKIINQLVSNYHKKDSNAFQKWTKLFLQDQHSFIQGLKLITESEVHIHLHSIYQQILALYEFVTPMLMLDKLPSVVQENNNNNNNNNNINADIPENTKQKEQIKKLIRTSKVINFKQKNKPILLSQPEIPISGDLQPEKPIRVSHPKKLIRTSKVKNLKTELENEMEYSNEDFKNFSETHDGVMDFSEITNDQNNSKNNFSEIDDENNNDQTASWEHYQTVSNETVSRESVSNDSSSTLQYKKLTLASIFVHPSDFNSDSDEEENGLTYDPNKK